MAMNEDFCPIARGSTHYGASATINTSDYGNSVDLEGQIHVLKDENPNVTATDLNIRKLYSQMPVKVVIVRNVSGITLMPGMAVSWASGYRGCRVNGYACATGAEVAGIVDDWLSASTGVRNGDLFLLIVKGPTRIRTAQTGTPTFSIDGVLYSSTAAASTANTTGGTTADDSGSLVNWALTSDVTGTTDGTLSKALLNAVAKAISAATAAETAKLKRAYVIGRDW